ncbi:MAG: 3-isopropylmalate dehydrogenase [Lysobacteraceae bacterium]|nr:MAG: 3-isopropylmalate dehydrogenase [Xanthomonadaceae bacterium]
MRADIVVLPGDGIGPEVTAAAVATLEAVGRRFGHDVRFQSRLIGGAAIDAEGDALSDATLDACRKADAILLGAVGGPRWADSEIRPEQGLLRLRKELGLYANLRPVRTHPVALTASPIKPHLLVGVDFIVVRELTGGVYFGARTRTDADASDRCEYSVVEIERVVRKACALARARRKYVVSVDKANVLETSRLWRQVATRIARDEFPDVRMEHQLVDSMAMHLLAKPREYDVIVTENMFGDILTDEASMLAGSMGLLPSASLGEARHDPGHSSPTRRIGLYEPIHGSAPDIAGRGLANPCGAILSAAMLLRHSLGLDGEARWVEKAVAEALDHGALTADLAPAGGGIGTEAMTRAVLARIEIEHQAIELRD